MVRIFQANAAAMQLSLMTLKPNLRSLLRVVLKSARAKHVARGKFIAA